MPKLTTEAASALLAGISTEDLQCVAEEYHNVSVITRLPDALSDLIAARGEIERLRDALKAMLLHCEGTNSAFYGAGNSKAMRAAFTGQKEIMQYARAALAATEAQP